MFYCLGPAVKSFLIFCDRASQDMILSVLEGNLANDSSNPGKDKSFLEILKNISISLETPVMPNSGIQIYAQSGYKSSVCGTVPGWYDAFSLNDLLMHHYSTSPKVTCQSKKKIHEAWNRTPREPHDFC